jgi:glycosyltransferase involved in cell wall biosynthesis
VTRAAPGGFAAVQEQGRQPEVVHEATKLGPAIDEAVAAARRRVRLHNSDEELLYEHFDVLHYLLSAPRLFDRPKLDPVRHFLATGLETQLSPDPDFSMATYLARHPERARSKVNPYVAWLKEGRAKGEIADPVPGLDSMATTLGMTPHQLVGLVSERRRDVQQRLRHGRLGEMITKAAEIEPLIGECLPEIANPKMVPMTTPIVTGELAALFQAHAAAGHRRARLVLVINRARWGAGRRMEGHLAHALADRVPPEDMVVIYTDDSTEGPPDRFPSGVREIDFNAITTELTDSQAEHALITLIRTFGADAVVNINSKRFYLAMRTYGKALTATERVFYCFFCSEQTAMGNWRGWSLRNFYRGFDDIAGVITDSHHLRQELLDTYRVHGSHRERIQVLSAPVDPTIPVVDAPPVDPERRPTVFWAGRLDRQKRINLVAELAHRMPDVEFRMWGSPVMSGQLPDLGPNVTLQGVYPRLTAIPLHEADVWLYTSGWDGVPSQLLEVAMTGIPLVGTLVGGTGEVLREGASWAVPAEGDAEAYEKAIREVLADPTEARRRARQLRDRLLAERTQESFARTAAAMLLVDEGGAG